MVARRALVVSLLLSSKCSSSFVWLPAASRTTRNSLFGRGRRPFHSETPHRVSVKWAGDENAQLEDPRERARDAFSKLAKRGRSWKRLHHLVHLACLCDIEEVRSIADVGCDHGLLSLALAVSGRFEHVVGLDVSEQALNDGAVMLYKQFLRDLENDKRWKNLSTEQLIDLFPVKFGVGDGLRMLESGEADALCIAGMGVNTISRILDPREVQRVGCQFLILQPTNSRPRNLIQLYDQLADEGWKVRDERIEYLSSRWYISTRFTREPKHVSVATANNNRTIPGQLLALSDHAYGSYVDHHRQWIERDSQKGASLNENDRRWLEMVDEQSANRP